MGSTETTGPRASLSIAWPGASVKHREHYLERELYQLIRDDPSLFDFLQAGSLDGVWYWDLERPEEEWLSPRFKEVLGYADHEVPNNSRWWQENIFPEDLQVALSNFEKHCADPGHPYDQLVRYRHKDASTVWVRCRGIAIREPGGRPIRMLGAHTVVTELKRAEEELQKAHAELERRVAERTEELRRVNEELERSNAELEQFAYVASHDLQEPLRKVATFTQLLAERLEGQLDDEAKRYVEFAVDGARRMRQLISELLAYSRVSTSRVPATATDASAVLDDVMENLAAAVRESGAEITWGALPVVRFEHAHLLQVLQNLMSNAIKFTRSGQRPRVGVGARREGDWWVFAVRDEGIGLDPSHADRIFRPFQRLHPRDRYPGSGMGLAVAKRVVERSGGRIWVEAREAEGATFYFEIPGVDRSAK